MPGGGDHLCEGDEGVCPLVHAGGKHGVDTGQVRVNRRVVVPCDPRHVLHCEVDAGLIRDGPIGGGAEEGEHGHKDVARDSIERLRVSQGQA